MHFFTCIMPHFWTTVTSNGLPYDTGHFSCLSVCNIGILWPNGYMDYDATWYRDGPRPWKHWVRWGPSSSTERGTAAPQFSAHVYCGQMAGWIRIRLGIEVGLFPGDIVLDGNPSPPRKETQHSHFSAHVYCSQTVAHLSKCWALVAVLFPIIYV